MVQALKRHAAGTALVIPILLRPVVSTLGQPWAELQSLPRDLRAVTTWPNLDQALADVARGVIETLETWSPALPAPSTRRPQDQEPLAEDRVLDAAVPSQVQVGQTSEVVALVRRPESGGLKAILALDDTFSARPEAVRSQELMLDFNRDERGRPLPLRLTLALESPDFDPPRQTKHVQVPPHEDSPTYIFLAVPKRPGLLSLQLELLAGDVSIVCHLLRSNAELRAPTAPRRYVMATLPLATRSVDEVTEPEELLEPEELELSTGVEEASWPRPEDTAPTISIPRDATSEPPPITATIPSVASPSSRSPSDSWPPRQMPPAPASATPPSDTWPPVRQSRATRQAPAPSPVPSRAGRGLAFPALGALAAVLLVSASAWVLVRQQPLRSSPPDVGPIDTRPPIEVHDRALVLANARVLYAKRDFAGVVALVDETANPTADLNQLAGRSLYEMGDYDRAAARFRLAVESEPTNQEHRELLRRALQQRSAVGRPRQPLPYASPKPPASPPP